MKCLSCCGCCCVLCLGSVERAEEQQGAIRATWWETVSPALCLGEHKEEARPTMMNINVQTHIQTLPGFLCEQLTWSHSDQNKNKITAHAAFLGLMHIFLRKGAAGGKTPLIGWVEPQWVKLRKRNHFLVGTLLLIVKVEAARPSCSLVKHIDQYSDWLFNTHILNSAKCLMLCFQLIMQCIDAFNG